MKKAFFLFNTLVLLIIGIGHVFAQEDKTILPFIIVIDNEFPDAEIISSVVKLADSAGMVKDSIICQYGVGKITMLKSDFTRLFEFKRKRNNKIYFKFTKRQFHTGLDIVYNSFFAPFQINDTYTILRIYNANIKENQEKFFFKKGQPYIYQVVTPGFSTLLPVRRKE